MFEATIAGSLPKPSWLAEPDKLWPAWRLAGPELAAAKRDATLLVIKEQEDAGIDIVTDGEQSRQHFVHGFLEYVEGIDFTGGLKWASATTATRPWCQPWSARWGSKVACTRPKRGSPAPTPNAG